MISGDMVGCVGGRLSFVCSLVQNWLFGSLLVVLACWLVNIWSIWSSARWSLAKWPVFRIVMSVLSCFVNCYWLIIDYQLLVGGIVRHTKHNKIITKQILQKQDECLYKLLLSNDFCNKVSWNKIISSQFPYPCKWIK